MRFLRGAAGSALPRFENWSGSVVAHPRSFRRPTTAGAVAGLVADAAADGETLRVVGAGHSFSPVAATDGHLVSLDALAGIVAVDAAAKTVRFRAGTRLRDIPALLEPYGLSLPNQGDIDEQSLAGALSTGTHGTGLGFTGFAGLVTALQLVTADGRVRELDPTREPELFDHARLSVGALGVLTEIELQCVDAFDLVADEARIPFDEMVETLEDRARTCDHVDYYWFPYADEALAKSNTRVPPGAAGPYPDVRRRPRLQRLLAEEMLDNAGLGLVNELSRAVPAATPRINRFATVLASNRRYRGPAHEVFVSPRRVRFREMEYAVPFADGAEVLREVRAAIESSGRAVAFPLEVRTAGADDVPLSTATGRDSVYIAVHQYHAVEEAGYFRSVERVLRAAAGRPHWGKIHSLGAEDLSALYPRFDDFVRVRDAVDPGRLFGSRYLTHLFGS
ncbi:D-arabinono-1,4-lactone oxidase [Brevibacterium yomogidense]|uniref:D-arabinono-1,4-lactone oxidase n=1 Tax=Brevibacterium yomogidense TaxID=946573 RepID=UPI0018DEF69E|nr:D-arabinono-1,4-lactone oxidase [Brevibacterium yomogidense]